MQLGDSWTRRERSITRWYNNIIGSNIFNILWVIGAAALVRDLTVDNKLLFTNIPIMLLVAALLLIFMAIKGRLERWQGGVFVAIYALFLLLNFW